MAGREEELPNPGDYLCTSRLDRALWTDPDDSSQPSVEAEAAWITTVFLRAFAVRPEDG